MDVKTVYDRQFKTIYMTAMIYLRNTYDAEDAVHDVFVKYMKKRVKFKDIEHERAWFIRTAINRCKDILKSSERKTVDIADFIDIIEAPDDEKALLSSILELPEKYREVIYAYYYEGYSVKEISSLFDIKESTIRTRLSVGREKLREGEI